MDEKNRDSLSREEIDRIAQDFYKSLNALKELPVPIDNDTSGIPIFSEEDIKLSRNKLDVLLRMLFVKYGITRLRFARQFQKYAVSVLLIAEMNINAQRENYLRAIKEGNITWKKFEQVLEVILGLKMSRITIDCTGIEGSKVSITAETDKIQSRSPDAMAHQRPFNLGDEKK